MKIRFLGEKNRRYTGFDPATKQSITVNEIGVVIDVSPEKAGQLVRDYPLDWELVKENQPASAAPTTEPEVPVAPEAPVTTAAPARGKKKIRR